MVRLLGALVTALVLYATPASAQFPERPVQIVVPYGTGGPADLLARLMASCLSERFRQPVVVLNRPGANGDIGANFVRNARPDGHTLLIHSSVTAIVLATQANPAYDVRRDLLPIMKLAFGVQGVYVNAALPIRSVPDLIAHARANPGRLNYGTVGEGSVNHLATEALAIGGGGLRMVHVTYAQGGTAAFLAALMAGDIQLALTDLSGAQATLDTGRIRLLAIMANRRLATRPDVPTLAEFVPEMARYFGMLWYGFFAPPGTPAGPVQTIHAAMRACLEDAEVRASLRRLGYEADQIVGDTPEAFRQSVLEDVAKFQEIVRRAGISLR